MREGALMVGGATESRYAALRFRPVPFRDSEAAEELETEHGRHPRWADLANRVGLLRLTRNDFAGAERAFAAALDQNPRYAWALCNLAAVRALRGAAEEAHRILEAGPEPGPGARALTEGWLALLSGRPGAVAAVNRRLPRTLWGRRDTSMFTEACDAAQAPFVRLPGLHELWRWWSVSRAEAGDRAGANEAADELERHWADPGLNLSHRAQLSLVYGDPQAARREYLTALQAAPHDATAPAALAQMAARDRKWSTARAFLSEALRRAPGYADLHRQMGSLAARLGDDEGALASYRRALRINPLYQRARAEEAAALARLGRWPEASRRLRTLRVGRGALPSSAGAAPGPLSGADGTRGITGSTQAFWASSEGDLG